MQISKPIFEWQNDTKLATCKIIINNSIELQGQAICHPDDFDFANEKTGCDIANSRALIKLYKWYKNNEVIPQLKAFQNFYKSIKDSKYFNSKSYENKMLQRQIRSLENELAIVNDFIADEKEMLDDYIEKKDNFYQRVRSMRRVQAEEDKHKKTESKIAE